MSELLDKQVYVQIEILKIIFQVHASPWKKCAMKMEVRKNDDYNRLLFLHYMKVLIL